MSLAVPEGLRLDRPQDTAWFGVLMAALLPSLLMLCSYTTATGLTVFTGLVALTVVTVAIPYPFPACAQLTCLVSKRRRVQGWALARDPTIAGAGVLFSMWVTFAAGGEIPCSWEGRPRSIGHRSRSVPSSSAYRIRWTSPTKFSRT